MALQNIFITGGTGYIGQRLIPLLAAKGHTIRALVRKGSEHKLPPGCIAVSGDALQRSTFDEQIRPSGAFVQLVGVPHPSPKKGPKFRSVDLVSVRASVAAATAAGIEHFVYVSVAQPAPMMHDYIAVRAEGENLIRASGMNATILRPWYVLGPGHRWPYLLAPGYWICERLPKTREAARRLGLVTLRQMLTAMVAAIEDKPCGVRVLEVPEIRRTAATAAKPAPGPFARPCLW